MAHIKKLTQLRINEISSVKRGAGEDCKVVICKRYDPDDDPPTSDLGRQLRKTFANVFRKKSEYDEEMSSPGFSRDPARTDTAESNYDAGAGERRSEDEYQDRKGKEQEADIIATRPILEPKLQSMVDAIRVHSPNSSEEEIVHFLLHTSRGRDVARHLSEITKQKEQPMSRIEKLKDIAKRHGVENIAKGMLTEGDAHGISEAEFTTLMTDEATRKGMSFEKYFTAPENIDIRRAWSITKSTPVDKALVEVQPMSVGVGSSDNNTDWQDAYAQLQEMAEKLRASAPYMSVSQAFARVFEDQKNAELAARAHKRPSATSSYPFPN
jgi:hypothetical protein